MGRPRRNPDEEKSCHFPKLRNSQYETGEFSFRFWGFLIDKTQTDTRLLIVGGAGSLFVNPEHTAVVSDGADFPAMFLPLAKAQGEELAKLRERNDVKWTFISPAGDFQADGERSGKYILAGEELTLNSKGESIISYADYAIAMVDEIEKGDHTQQRISVVRE